MSTTLTLLGLPNAQAQTVMVEELLAPGVALVDLKINPAQRIDDFTMRIPVASSEGALLRPNWPYRGEANVNFGKLSLADTFGQMLIWFQLPLPTTTGVIAAKMAEIFQIHFDEHDIVNEPVDFVGEMGTIIFRASNFSQRWSGVLPIRIFRGTEG